MLAIDNFQVIVDVPAEVIWGSIVLIIVRTAGRISNKGSYKTSIVRCRMQSLTNSDTCEAAIPAPLPFLGDANENN